MQLAHWTELVVPLNLIYPVAQTLQMLLVSSQVRQLADAAIAVQVLGETIALLASLLS